MTTEKFRVAERMVRGELTRWEVITEVRKAAGFGSADERGNTPENVRFEAENPCPLSCAIASDLAQKWPGIVPKSDSCRSSIRRNLRRNFDRAQGPLGSLPGRSF